MGPRASSFAAAAAALAGLVVSPAPRAPRSRAAPSRGRAKTLLSLFDFSGAWARPFEEGGWDVLQIDLKHGDDVGAFSAGWLLENVLEGFVIDGIVASPPCTDFAASGARHWAAKDADGRTAESVHLVYQTLRTVDFLKPDFWCIENPVGRIARLVPELGHPACVFDPCDYAGWNDVSAEDLARLDLLRARRPAADFTAEEVELVKDTNAYTKRTQLWGPVHVPDAPAHRACTHVDPGVVAATARRRRRAHEGAAVDDAGGLRAGVLRGQPRCTALGGARLMAPRGPKLTPFAAAAAAIGAASSMTRPQGPPTSTEIADRELLRGLLRALAAAWGGEHRFGASIVAGDDVVGSDWQAFTAFDAGGPLRGAFLDAQLYEGQARPRGIPRWQGTIRVNRTMNGEVAGFAAREGDGLPKVLADADAVIACLDSVRDRLARGAAQRTKAQKLTDLRRRFVEARLKEIAARDNFGVEVRTRTPRARTAVVLLMFDKTRVEATIPFEENALEAALAAIPDLVRALRDMGPSATMQVAPLAVPWKAGRS